MDTPTIRTALQSLVENLMDVNVRWSNQPEEFAGPGGFLTGAPGGLQGSLHIDSVASLGHDYDDIEDNGSGGFNFVRRGIRQVDLSVSLWSWSQEDPYHPSGYLEQLRSMLQAESSRLAMDLAGMSFIDAAPTVSQDEIEDDRVVAISVLPCRFYVSLDTYTNPGAIIQAVRLSSPDLGILEFQVGVAAGPINTQGGTQITTQGGTALETQGT